MNDQCPGEQLIEAHLIGIFCRDSADGFAAPVQSGLGNQVGADRRGQKEKNGYQ